jgi:hypothetical protein
MKGKHSRSQNTRTVNLGIPEGVPLSRSDVERFWAKVQRSDDASCWPWQASRTGSLGYGQFGYQAVGGRGTGASRQRHAYAHRIAWSLSHGPIPDGASICHHCDNPICCNAAHLFIGDHTANMRDAASKRRLSVTRPNRQKLTDEQVDAILTGGAIGRPQKDLAAEFGVTRSYICQLLKGKRRQLPRRKAA